MIFFVFTVIFFFNFTRLHAPLSAAVLRHGGPVYKWKAQSIMDQRAWVVTTRSIDVTRLLWEAPAEGLYIYITSNNPTTTTTKKKRSNISAKLPTLNTLPSDTSFNTMRPKWNISLALFLYCLGGQVLAWQKCPFRGGKTLLFFSFFVNTKWVFLFFFFFTIIE